MKKITKSKYNLSSKEQKLCHGIIHSASGSAAAVGAGLAQLPLADNAVITPIQITMIISLGKVFDQNITKTIAQSLLGGFVANFVGRGVAQAAIGWVPAIGNVTNAVTAATITESIGWLSVDYFYKARYLDKDVEARKETQKMNYERPEGKGFAIIKKTCDVVKDGEKGSLVWDYLVVNEITFVNERTKETESLYKGWDDDKTEKEFNKLAQKYAPKKEKKSDVKDEKNEKKDALRKLAEQFIQGEKSRLQNAEEYMKCMAEFDEVLYGLPETDSLYELYRQFLDVR